MLRLAPIEQQMMMNSLDALEVVRNDITCNTVLFPLDYRSEEHKKELLPDQVKGCTMLKDALSRAEAQETRSTTCLATYRPQ